MYSFPHPAVSATVPFQPRALVPPQSTASAAPTTAQKTSNQLAWSANSSSSERCSKAATAVSCLHAIALLWRWRYYRCFELYFGLVQFIVAQITCNLSTVFIRIYDLWYDMMWCGCAVKPGQAVEESIVVWRRHGRSLHHIHAKSAAVRTHHWPQRQRLHWRVPSSQWPVAACRQPTRRQRSLRKGDDEASSFIHS